MPFTRQRLIANLLFSRPIRHCSSASCPSTLPKKPEHICSFEQQIADKIHSDLVLRKHQPPAPIVAAYPPLERSTVTTQAPSLRVRVASALAKTDLGLALPSELVDDDVIVKGKQHKIQIPKNTKQSLEMTTQNQSSQRKKVSTLMNPSLDAPLACRRPSRNTIESKN